MPKTVFRGGVRTLSSPYLTRTLLERTHEELQEREANYSVCLRYLLERGGKDELVSVPGRVRETLRAELVPLMPRAAARSAATFLKHRSNRSAASPHFSYPFVARRREEP